MLTLSLATYNASDGGNLEEILNTQFHDWEDEYNVGEISSDLSSRFRNIIKAAYNHSGKPVVILIDEYDNPLIATMHDPERSEANRQLLKSVYVNTKDLDQFIRFTMLTGVSRFSKMTIFSGLNNLEDISFDDEYASICGITEEELLSNFQEGISNLAKKYSISNEEAIARLKTNYDGYHFAEVSPDIYNPFSLLNALKKRKIGAYWFQSATPEFLVRQIQKSNEFLPRMFDETVEARILSANDIFSTRPTALLYQTGYLTIKRYEEPDRFHLGIPNLEVRKGLFENLASYLMKKDDTDVYNSVSQVIELL